MANHKADYFVENREGRLDVYFMPGSLRAYIYGIARLIFIQRVKQQREEKALMAQSGNSGEGDRIILDIPWSGTEQLEGMTAEADFIVVSQYLDLNPRDWEIIRLRMIEKRQHGEIAARMGYRNANTSRQQLHKAVVRLREFLTEHNIEQEMACKVITRYYYEMP